MSMMHFNKRFVLLAVIAVAAVLGLVACSGKTTGATNITFNSATLNAQGACGDNGDKTGNCTYYFRYGTGGSYQNQTPTRTAGKTCGTGCTTSFHEDVTGLPANTTITYQVCGKGDGFTNNNSPDGTYCVGPDGGTGTASTFTTSTAPSPHGPSGTWTLAFDDEFSGSSLDTTKWTNTWFNGGSINGVATVASNVTVGGGAVSLQLSDATHGALIHTTQATGRYSLPVGGVLEARISFPGNGTNLYNWPAFWANDTNNYPAAGENDIAEVLSPGVLTVNYHSPSGDFGHGAVPGYWGDAYHTYTLQRKVGACDVYYDGTLVKSYTTSDNGGNEDVILNVGVGKGPTQTGAAGAIKVDYVRAWR